MYSQRFHRPVQLTQHARRRMAEREISEELLMDLIDTGEVRHKDERRLWIAKRYESRTDNLICVAVVLENTVIVKTVMHHFTWETGA